MRVVAEACGEGVVEPEGGEAVHEAPGRDAGEGDVGPAAGGGDGADSAVEGVGGALSRGRHRGVVGVVEVRAEHDLEVGAVVDREAHVGHPDVEEVPGLLLGGGEGVGQQVVALGGDGGEQAGLVPEVVRRRGVGDPGAAGQLAQAQPGRAGLGEGVDRGRQDRLTQVAVVVGAVRRHESNVPAI